MTSYQIQLGYTISSRKENSSRFNLLTNLIKDYNVEISSTYIDFNRNNIITNRSVSIVGNYEDISKIINLIPVEYLLIYAININDDYKILYSYEGKINNKKLNDEEKKIYDCIMEKINLNKEELKLINELELKIENIKNEIELLNSN
jgi:hypothetical protein